jgi:hypothetical protein
MNWFTRVSLATSTVETKQEYADQDSVCEHVEGDINLAHAVRREMDSLGSVGTYVCCKACDEQVDEEAGNEQCVCRDCKQPTKLKDGFNWRWYDFYAPQGDEPVFICNGCRDKPTHQARVRQDNDDRYAEFGD